MRIPTTLLGIVALWAAGCATPNVNPAQARANTGYVDFHANSPGELCWEVAHFDGRTQAFQRDFSELEPPSGGILRLAFAPGNYRLRITFINRVVREPAFVEVEVQDGMITPVRVVLTADGTTLVQRKEPRLGGTAKGRYGRSTKVSSDESTMYRVSAVAAPPVAYQPKERTSYAR